jgi:hypothetical protein
MSDDTFAIHRLIVYPIKVRRSERAPPAAPSGAAH